MPRRRDRSACESPTRPKPVQLHHLLKPPCLISTTPTSRGLTATTTVTFPNGRLNAPEPASRLSVRSRCFRHALISHRPTSLRQSPPHQHPGRYPDIKQSRSNWAGFCMISRQRVWRWLTLRQALLISRLSSCTLLLLLFYLHLSPISRSFSPNKSRGASFFFIFPSSFL